MVETARNAWRRSQLNGSNPAYEGYLETNPVANNLDAAINGKDRDTGERLDGLDRAFRAGRAARDAIIIVAPALIPEGVGLKSDTNCFVAGTPILIPEESRTEALIVSAAIEDGSGSASQDLLMAVGVVMVGMAGYRDEKKRANRARKQSREGLEFLWRPDENKDDQDFDFDGSDDGPRDLMNWRNRIDVITCPADCHADATVPGDPATPSNVANSPSTITGPACPPLVVVARPKGASSEIPRPPAAAADNVFAGLAAAHSVRVSRGSRTAEFKKSKSIRRGGRLWLVACLLIAALFADKANWHPSAPRSTVPTASAVSVAPAKQPPWRPIEAIRVGQRVIAGNPDLGDAASTEDTAVDRATWRLVRLHGEDRWPDGTLDTIEVETLQPPEWIEANHASPGASVPLPMDLVEMGMPGDLRARVEAVERCPAIPDGPGKVVLTTINHLNRYVFALELSDVAGRAETVRATGFHKFYNDDRKEWVSVDKLRPGNRVPGVAGLLTVKSIARLPGVQRVYNMTVEDDHVYHVATFGALVHNVACAPEGVVPTRGAPGAAGAAGKQTFRDILTPAEQAEFEALQAKHPEWMPKQGLDTPATVRSVAENAEARAQFTGHGHHPQPLKFGGEPNPPDLVPTGETQTVKNPIHTEITNWWNKVLRRINSGQ